MAGSFNSITLVGYVGRDPEGRTTAAGHPVATFTIATDDRRKDQEERQTTWFRISCFGRIAEIAQQYLHKGSYTLVQGSLSQESFTDRDGQQRTSLEVRARDVQMLDRPAEREGNSTATSPRLSRVSNGPPKGDDIPF